MKFLLTSNIALFTDLAVADLEGYESVWPAVVVLGPGEVGVEVVLGVEECLHLQVLQPAPGVIVRRGLPDRHLDQSELSIQTADQSQHSIQTADQSQLSILTILTMSRGQQSRSLSAASSHEMQPRTWTQSSSQHDPTS